MPKKALAGGMVDVQFREFRNGKPKIISFFAKKARGMMARYMVENRIDTVEGLKSFDLEGYRFNSELSKPSTLVFTRLPQ